MRHAFRFFAEHAGYAVGERAKGALALARAEEDAKARGFVFVWEDDPFAEWSFLEQTDARGRFLFSRSDREAMRTAESCCVVRPCPKHGAKCPHADTLASLSGIIDADSDYRRVIEAELALEALHTEYGSI